ncbi:MAG: hypothetical protein ACYCY8_05825 [Burkholderiales bacterium]
MNLQNLAYAVDQSIHNLGAVSVTGGAILALLSGAARRKLAWLVLSGWGVQGMTGALFGVLSYAFYGHLPDIAGIAVDALVIKMACAASGFFLAAFYLRQARTESTNFWRIEALLAIAALTAASFLRWFS